MFFFVNQYLLSSNSSVEHAEIKRLKLFKANHTAAKLVTRDFDPIIHATLRRFGLDDSQLVNMFDFFAGTIDYQGQMMHTEDLHLPFDYQVGTGNNSRDVMDGQRLVAQVFFVGGTVGQVDRVDWYDPAGNMTLRERYDLRGYKAVDQFFGQNGQTHFERYYRPDGTCYMERYYVQSVQNTPINSLNVLRDYQGKDYYFDTIDDLYVFFLNELNKSTDGTNTFIADRPAMAIQPVLKVDDARRYLWLPINHVNDGQDLLNGPMNGMLQDPFTTNLKKWDGIIVMTEQQAHNLRKRLGKKAPILAINGVPVKQPLKRINMNKRTPGQLIYVGRLGEDKQISQLISIFAGVHQQTPTARLTLYGYGAPADVQRYKDQVKQAGLDDAVTFAGYQVNLQQAYDQAQLFVDTSRIDAQPLAMGEALSHGVPVVSYNYLYGPAGMVESGVNGELIPLNNQEKFIATLVSLLKDPKQLQSLSNGAYAHLDAISNEATWRQWAPVVENK
ncbi:accessory Sec system glycosyltransferase Asp1 [Limosilactobacillus sp.]|uniref:accessory Sec system glycosyltransferase Asp1 n=1 Tax=Limosilactobacillus sp. TaxID=2773925 RepID=UPI0025C17F89|nr:accessory Sec system glycosyltransferase Asp1 [Limosilactobacillus sp.]MCH3921771.1 accessory Sec system glycosyltransferase Asp1 [Limosilactobacillus sp.]MCH3928542.1 accessory Sec system glycosyltransferase Asp1 [Limosilactobacillus sp.]